MMRSVPRAVGGAVNAMTIARDTGTESAGRRMRRHRNPTRNALELRPLIRAKLEALVKCT